MTLEDAVAAYEETPFEESYIWAVIGAGCKPEPYANIEFVQPDTDQPGIGYHQMQGITRNCTADALQHVLVTEPWAIMYLTGTQWGGIWHVGTLEDIIRETRRLLR